MEESRAGGCCRYIFQATTPKLLSPRIKEYDSAQNLRLFALSRNTWPTVDRLLETPLARRLRVRKKKRRREEGEDYNKQDQENEGTQREGVTLPLSRKHWLKVDNLPVSRLLGNRIEV